MQLSVKDVARFLNLSEKNLYRMIDRGEIPAQKVHDQYRFNRTELLEWIMAHRRPMNAEFAAGSSKTGAGRAPLLSEALEAGGIHYRIGGADKQSVLRSLVSVLRLPPDTDRDLLFKMLLAREAMASTSIGRGIAVPHARNPMVLQVAKPQIALCFLQTPIDFQALDNQKVFALFSIITPGVRIHLNLLSRLAFALQDKSFYDAISRRGTADEITRELLRVEASFAPGKEKAR